MTKSVMEIVRRIAAVIAVVLGIAWTGLAETVENVRGSQRENSKLVDIYYNLNDTDGGTYYVAVEVVGRTSEVTASSFSGDVGEGVVPGQNRHVVWDAGADWPGNKGDVKAVVTAIKGGKRNKVQLWDGGPYWADRNIGADKPEDYGLYFWWGDTTGHRPSGTTFSFSFTESNCPTYGKSQDQLRNEGWITSNGVLSPSHDAARVHWGGSWRMPTDQELYDLCYNKCDWTCTRGGYIVRGRGDYAANSIFLPFAGKGNETSLDDYGSRGYCWSSVPIPSLYANVLYCSLAGYHYSYKCQYFRYDGIPVRPIQDFATSEDATGSSGWFFVDTTDKPEVLVHFNANGGVFRDKDGNEVTQFDQCFVYGEPQRLFTDELTPMKPDENGNQFLGWVRGTPNVYSDSDIIDGREEETFYEYDGTETTYYAVWTTTVTVSFYNNTDVNSGSRILSPGSLGNHLSWSVDDDVRRFKNGESVQVLPGQRIIRLYVDDEYHWIAGRFDLGSYESSFHRAYDYLELNIGNDFRDVLVYGSTPREYGHHIYVKVEPDISQPETHGDVVFFYSAAVREELRGLINAQRGNVPAFDISKVRISIGKTAVNQAGNVVEDLTHGLTGLELRKYYCLPTGLYYLKDVAYDADTSSGDPYWGAVLDSTFENLLFEVKDSRITERTINFDVFGGHAAVRVVFDPQGGECAKSEMWLLYHSTPYSNSGWISIDKKTAESLPTPEKGEDFKLGWFTERSGGLELKSGATISGDKVHWILPFEHTFYAYAQWTDMKDYWLLLYPKLAALSGGDIVTAAKMTAANGCRTVGECYALGINPEDPNDDLKIADFKMEGGKPVITLNHTEDGSGNSFADRVRTLGKEKLTDAEWKEVPESGNPDFRFFTIGVDMP